MSFVRKIVSMIGPALALMGLVACGGGGSSDSADSGADTDSDSDTDSDVDAGRDACMITREYLDETCGFSEQDLADMYENCTVLKEAFTDSFMDAFAGCIMGLGCNGIAWDMSSDDSPVKDCMDQAAVEAEPDQINIDFITYLCEMTDQCSDSTIQECEAGLDANGDALLIKVIGQPYIGDMVDCVHPMPSCSTFIDACIRGVLDDLEMVIGDLELAN